MMPVCRERLLVFQYLTQTAARGVRWHVQITNIVHHSASTFTHHQHFILPVDWAAAVVLVTQCQAQWNIFRIGIRNGRRAGNGCAVRPLNIAGEEISGYRMLAVVLTDVGQILIQHFAQVRLQLNQTASVYQSSARALFDAQVIEPLCNRISAACYTAGAAGAYIFERWFNLDAGTQQ